jgi:regulator of protease activity HflC (stomatin/prohibitin superfamily)
MMRTIYGFVYTLRPYERGIQETLGKYSRFVMPGLGFQIPLVHIIRVLDVREHTIVIEPRPVITNDNVEITVDGVMKVLPTVDEEGIKRIFNNIDNWKRAVIQLATTNLCQEFSELSLDESLVAREKIANNLQRILNTFTVEWGLTVSKVKIRLIDPPDNIKKAIRKQKTVEQERRSMKLPATSEFETAEQQNLATI